VDDVRFRTPCLRKRTEELAALTTNIHDLQWFNTMQPLARNLQMEAGRFALPLEVKNVMALGL
jgi:hypothetical protein